MTIKGSKVKLSSKQGVKRVIKLFQGSKMLSISKKDKKCKVFGFRAKTVKIVKSWVLTENYYSKRTKTVNKINFELKPSFQQIYDTKVSRKCFKG